MCRHWKKLILANLAILPLALPLPEARAQAVSDSTQFIVTEPQFYSIGVNTGRIQIINNQVNEVHQDIQQIESDIEEIEEEKTEVEQQVQNLIDYETQGDVQDLDEEDKELIDAKVVGILGYPLPNRLPTEDEFIIFRGDRWEYEVIYWPAASSGGTGVSWGGDWWGQLGQHADTQYGYYFAAGLMNAQVNGEQIYHAQAFPGPAGSSNYNIVAIGGGICFPGSCSQNNEQAWDTLNLFYPPGDMHFAGKWLQLSAGSRHSCGIDEDNLAWCWGYGFNGRLGHGVLNTVQRASEQIGTVAYGHQHLSHSSFPIRVATYQTFSKIAAGHRHSCAIDTEGEIWCWGNNAHGEFGLGGSVSISILCQNGVSNPEGYEEHCPAGLYTTRTITQTVGLAPNQQLTESADPLYRQELVPGPWVDIGAGEWFTCALHGTGNIWCWGRGQDGQFGFNPGAPSSSVAQHYTYNNFWVGDNFGSKITSNWIRPFPQQVPGLVFTQMSVGKRHVCGIDVESQAWCWGWNQYGAVSGSGNPVWEPRMVGNPGQFKKISAGALHSWAIDQDDEAWCWGYGGAGRLGNGATTNQQQPVKVASGEKFKDIATRALHTCAIALDGRAWCWGDNSTGVINPYSPHQPGWEPYYTTPQLIADTANLTSIHVGMGFTIATKAN